MVWILQIVLGVAVSACGSDGASDGGDDVGGDADGDADADGDGDSDADADADTDADADADGDADADADADADTDGDGDGDADCTPPEPAEECSLVSDPCLPGEMEVGTGDFSFEELSVDGQDVQLVHGPQGGYHVFGAVRERDLAIAPGVTVLFSFRPVGSCDSTMLGDARSEIDIGEQSFLNAGDGWLAAYGFLVILDTTQPTELDGRMFVLGVELTDAVGDVYRDEAVVTVRWEGD